MSMVPAMSWTVLGSRFVLSLRMMLLAHLCSDVGARSVRLQLITVVYQVTVNGTPL
jgi:hypothetical protein